MLHIPFQEKRIVHAIIHDVTSAIQTQATGFSVQFCIHILAKKFFQPNEMKIYSNHSVEFFLSATHE